MRRWWNLGLFVHCKGIGSFVPCFLGLGDTLDVGLVLV